jgi:hypothetical protein
MLTNGHSKPAPELSPRTEELLKLEERYSAGGIYPLPGFIKSGNGSILEVCYSKSLLGGYHAWMPNVSRMSMERKFWILCV